MHWRFKKAFAHKDVCWEPAAPYKHISLSPSHSPSLIFSRLLLVIPLPHLSLSPFFAGHVSTPLATKKRKAGREICCIAPTLGT